MPTEFNTIFLLCYCLSLVITVAIQAGGLAGDGYNVGSPHTEHEAFAGLGLERAAEVGETAGWHWPECGLM